MDNSDTCERIIELLIAEQRKVQASGSLIATIMMTYSFIDAMAWASLPEGRDEVKRTDFISWVESWMQTSAPFEYQYNGDDVYNARCAMLHTLSPQIRRGGRRFGYHGGIPHRYRPDIAQDLVMVSVPLLVNDLWSDVSRFMLFERQGQNYSRIADRFGEMFNQLPYSANSGSN